MNEGLTQSYQIFMDMLNARFSGDPLVDPAHLARIAVSYSCTMARYRAMSNMPVAGIPEYFGRGFFGGDQLVDEFLIFPEIEAALITYGNAYLRKVPADVPERLDWYHPSLVEVKEENGFLIGYDVLDPKTNKQKTFSAAEMIHFRDWNPSSNFVGLAALATSSTPLNIERFQQLAAQSLWQRGGVPLGFLTTDGTVSPTQAEKIRTWWNKLFSNARTAFRTGFIGGGLRWEGVESNPDELAGTEQRIQNRLDVCISLGVHPALIGVEPANYATLREVRMQFYEELMIPRAWRIINTFNQLLPAQMVLQQDRIPALRRLGQMHEQQGFRETPDGDGEEWTRD